MIIHYHLIRKVWGGEAVGLHYYLTRDLQSKEAKHLVLCMRGEMGLMDRINYVNIKQMYVEDISQAEFETYAEFGFEVVAL